MGVVYFAQASRAESETDASANFPRVHAIVGEVPAGMGPIKIGVTDHLHRRLLAISSLARKRVWLLGAFIGDRDDEQRTHSMFAHLRLRSSPPFPRAGTEWFSQAWELTNFILSLPRPPIADLEFTMRSIKRWPGHRDRLIVLDPSKPLRPSKRGWVLGERRSPS